MQNTLFLHKFLYPEPPQFNWEGFGIQKKSKASMLCSGLVYVILIAASCRTELASYIGGVEQLSAVLAGAERLLIVCHCFSECEVDHRLKRIILAQQVQSVPVIYLVGQARRYELRQL